jgi:hypothetical protein
MLATAAGLSTLLFIGVGGAIGARILWLARSTRGLPEAVLGFSLLVIVGFGYPLSLAGSALAESHFGLGRFLLVLASVCTNAGWAGVFLFTWKVFRPASSVARAGAVLAMGLLGLCVVATAARLAGLASAARVSDPALPQLATEALALVSYVWTGVESAIHYGRHRRRLALGLSDPVLANRFLLWAVVSVFSFASLVVPFAVGLGGRAATESPTALAVTAVAGLACSVTLYLAFLPPAVYRRWLVAGAAGT